LTLSVDQLGDHQLTPKVLVTYME